MIGVESLQFYGRILKFGFALGAHPYRWNGIDTRPCLELSTSRRKLVQWYLSFLFHVTFCASQAIRSIHVMSSANAGTAEKIFISSVTVYYSIQLAYQFTIASNLQDGPRFISDFICYFGKEVDLQYEQITGGPFSNTAYVKMKNCQKFVRTVNYLYWLFYAILLAGAVLKPFSPHVILSLTWPVRELSLNRQVCSILAFAYFFICFLQNGTMIFWIVFTWFRAIVLTLQQLA